MAKLTNINKSSLVNEDVYSGFQTLRNDQRLMASKLSEMEAELNEHRIVIDTLKNIDSHRKCYRLLGGVLCERSVEEVVPCLTTNEKHLVQVIKNLDEQLTKKGTEINEYKKKHKIFLKGEDALYKTDSSKKETQAVLGMS